MLTFDSHIRDDRPSIVIPIVVLDCLNSKQPGYRRHINTNIPSVNISPGGAADLGVRFIDRGLAKTVAADDAGNTDCEDVVTLFSRSAVIVGVDVCTEGGVAGIVCSRIYKHTATIIAVSRSVWQSKNSTKNNWEADNLPVIRVGSH